METLEFIKKHGTKLSIAALSLVTIIAIATTVWAVWFRKAPVLNPDYAAQETEKDAEKIEGSEGGDDSEIDGGKISVIYSREVTVDLSAETAELLIGNRASSKHNIVVEIVIQGEVILQSGAIMPGYRVVKLDLVKNAAKMLQAGVYNGTIKLYLYNTQTNEREMLSSEIDAEITVVE